MSLECLKKVFADFPCREQEWGSQPACTPCAGEKDALPAVPAAQKNHSCCEV